MFNSKNLILLVIFVAVVGVFGYMLLLMGQPSPYARIFATHVKSHDDKAASQVLAMIKETPACSKVNISRDSLLEYYKSQECFILKTEIRTHRPPTDAELLSAGSKFITEVSSKLKMCLSPEKQRKLMESIESGKNLQKFSGEIATSRGSPSQFERIAHKMGCAF